MTATAVQDRNAKAAEYLQLLRSLASEMEKAMQAIAHNRLPDLEDSVSSQQWMSAKLLSLANEISPSFKPVSASARAHAAATHPDAEATNADVMRQVQVANDALQKLNRRYAALLEHSSRSIALMASLFGGYQGQFERPYPQQTKEASGPRPKHQTWSCRM